MRVEKTRTYQQQNQVRAFEFGRDVCVNSCAADDLATGGGWSALASGTATSLSGVWGAGPGNIVVVGDTGLILRSTNGGATAAGRQRRAWYFSRIGPNFFQSSVWMNCPWTGR